MSLFSCLAWLKATVDITDGTRTRNEAFTSVSTLPAAAEDAHDELHVFVFHHQDAHKPIPAPTDPRSSFDQGFIHVHKTNVSRFYSCP